ncbi:tetratricopeptide repeat protein [Aquimonas voraii]|uniref:Tetratricopeptide repeat-containing protein n=1 Tax=Aquimonas voraii TaxID=265719 RepID=A0A1G6XE02_9GAMM|nr:tetratricopeptide repeat protein [Aquimonas voraii]SDD76282.1 Tetratricopeptide repeat-containing protein [Aquimonas voraii]
MLQPIQDALRRNDLDTAIRLAREALASLPSSPDLLHLLALALLQKGQVEEGEDALTQAVALAPHRGHFLLTRAELAFARGEQDAAYADLRHAVEQDPNLLAGYVGLARLEVARGQLDLAESRIKYGRRIEAEHPALLRAEGELEMARGNLDAALSAFDRAVKQQPNNPELHLALGMVFQRRGLPAVAAQALRNTLRLAPHMRVAQRLLVTVLLDANEPQAAQEQLLQILQREPGDAGGWGLLSRIAMGLGNVAGCEQAMLQSLALEPEQPALLSALLNLWERANARDRARAGLDALLKQHSQSVSLWNARFSLDVALPEGEAVLQRWREAQPGSLDVEEAAAQRAHLLGQREEAEAIARALLEKDPQRVGAELLLVRAERERDPEAALARLAALAQRPLNVGLRRGIASLRGMLLDQLDRPEEALDVWLEVHRMPPGELPLGLPLPAHLPAGPQLAADAPRGADARLLWPLPGTPVGAVLNSLGGLALCLVDRFNSSDRADGLGPLRPQAGNHGEQGAEGVWRSQLAARGLQPAQVIDVLPHVDAEIVSALPDAKLLALIGDPRDVLLAWIAFGSLQGYAIQQPELLASWLAEGCACLQQRLQAAPGLTRLLRVEDLAADPQTSLRAAAEFLGLEGNPGDYIKARGEPGNVLELAPGRWRRYREGELAEAFARLAPAAEALGYAP